jgi:nucleotide-binding universal stress UspA family protein
MPTSAYKSALLPMISYPQPTLPAALAGALDAALALNLRIVGLNLEINPPIAAGFSGYAMPIVGTTIDAEEAKTKANAEAIAREFTAQTKHRELDAELRRVACDALDSPGLTAVAGRLFDLIIVPIAPQSRADRELAEAVVFGSGRPVLLLPPYWAVQITPFDRPLIAWDATRAAARALNDALPMLRRAREIFLVAVTPDASEIAQTLPDVQRWLNEHGVRVNCARIDADGLSAAAAIAAHAKAVRANLIVMGAFGHSRVRDFILGGVTRSVLAEPILPILFSH